MAETEAEKPQTLAEEKVEQEDQGEIPMEAAEDENPTIAAPHEVIVAKADETLAVMESIEASEQEESEEQEAVEQTPEIKIETAPADFRFPTTNQTRYCFTRYIEYHRCIAAKGDGASECQKFSKYYRSLCPGEWIDRWNEQRENGTFPGPL
ncbi:cytochrome c oxidase subunit 6b-1-like protein [Cinnamomum micranthum f. kanehirae]|uniref:Cytochrome c oxidase subunit 6b-1-like protein n=1 Tax=Cinnamomum micranthum f. kanehirae TaxID=337451 RepID=A0A3S3N0M6_9MAGN|nr:cytochrome c oxidase subunit 6b-1-like protein [Cinnamomum micranthum f. kanehirae]